MNRTVVVGAGGFGINYVQNPLVDCVAIVDIDKEVGNRFNQPIYTSIDEVQEKFDYAIVCTPPSTHVQLALKLLNMGKKVLVEKPIAVDMASMTSLLGWTDDLFCANVYLYNSYILGMKEELDEFAIDHIFSRRTQSGPVRPWQNALWDLAPHDIAIIMYLMGGPPIGVTASGNMNHAIFSLEFPLDIWGTVYVSWMGGPKVRTLEIHSRDVNVESKIFNEQNVGYDKMPLDTMLENFYSGNWDERCSPDFAMNVVNVLTNLQSYGGF